MSCILKFTHVKLSQVLNFLYTRCVELRSILFLVANGHHNCIKCTKADVRLRTPDDGQKGCQKHVGS